ncbi:MAG: GNAT family N-acetyltransferase [Anaerolineales bacterium]|nr:GNAT family N-acetyltransferase [Anaerolineales bacterium]
MIEQALLNDAVIVPDAPAGFVCRRFRGEGDFPRLAKIINAVARACEHDFIQRADELANDYAHLTNCDLSTDFVFVETVDGREAAYGRVWWDQEVDGLYRYHITLNVHPDFREPPDLERALLAWAEDRLRAIAAAHPADAPKVFQVWVPSSNIDTQRVALLEAAGYRAVRWGYLMRRDLSEPIEERALPAGLEVRPVTPADYRKVWEAHHEAFRDHWGYREPTEDEYRGWLTSPTFDASLWQVAFAGDEVAGMVLNVIPHDENEQLGVKRGWTDPISVRRPWRKMGLAKALLLRSLRLLREQGMTEAMLGVDTQNPHGALQLYESCGFRPVKRSTTYRKDL